MLYFLEEEVERERKEMIEAKREGREEERKRGREEGSSMDCLSCLGNHRLRPQPLSTCITSGQLVDIIHYLLSLGTRGFSLIDRFGIIPTNTVSQT